MSRLRPFVVFRHAAVALASIYLCATLGRILDWWWVEDAGGQWFHPTAAGLILAAALAIEPPGRQLQPLRLWMIGLLGVLFLAPRMLGAVPETGLWPAAADGWPSWLMLSAVLACLATALWPHRHMARLEGVLGILLVLGSGLTVAGNVLKLDLIYGQPALAARPLPLAAAELALAFALLRQRAGLLAHRAREEVLISRIGLCLLALIAFATGLISFAAVEDEIESALYQQLQVSLQNRQFVFYAALDSIHLNAAPLLRDPQLARLVAEPGTRPETMIAAVEALLPAASPSQTARAGLDRALWVRRANGQQLARKGDFLPGSVLWSNTRKRSRISLKWYQGVPFVVQQLDLEDRNGAPAGEVVIQQAMPAWEQLVDVVDDIGRTGKMSLCGQQDGQILCLQSRERTRLWNPLGTALYPAIEGAALYGERSDPDTPAFIAVGNGAMQVYASRPVGRLNLSRSVASNGLMMLVTLDAQEFYAPLRRQLNRIVLLVLPVLLAGAWLLAALLRPLARALRQKELRFRELTELSSDWYWSMDEALRFVEIVGKGLQSSGIRPEDWIGRRVDALPVCAEDAATAAALAREMTESRTFHAVLLRLSVGAAAEPRHLEFSGAPQYDGPGRFRGYRGVCIDVTRRRIAELHLQQAQKELMRAEKLASLGSLVAGVAHELNTPLGNGVTLASSLAQEVRGFARTLEVGSLKRSALADFMAHTHETVALIETSLDRAVRSVQQFKQVAVDQSSEARRRYDLFTVMDEIRSLLQPRLRSTAIGLVVTIPPAIVMDGYPGPLGQVIENLVLNALTHAFEGRAGGVIEISARHAGPGFIEMVVHDSGCGMTPEVQARAFEPFFTTRLGSGGSGLGLYIAHNIVTGVLGGRIRLESPPGAGCSVILSLPCVAPS